MNETQEIKVYTLDEVAKILKVTKRTIYNYIKGGQLVAVKIGREWRVTERELKFFLRQGTDKNYLVNSK